MEIVCVFLAVAWLLTAMLWCSLPRIKETIVFRDANDELKHLESTAENFVKQVEEKYGSMEGEFKRSQAFRMMQQIFPNEYHGNLVIAIELAVKKCLGQ
jgi:hypothetical protein